MNQGFELVAWPSGAREGKILAELRAKPATLRFRYFVFKGNTLLNKAGIDSKLENALT